MFVSPKLFFQGLKIFLQTVVVCLCFYCCEDPWSLGKLVLTAVFMHVTARLYLGCLRLSFLFSLRQSFRAVRWPIWARTYTHQALTADWKKLSLHLETAPSLGYMWRYEYGVFISDFYFISVIKIVFYFSYLLLLLYCSFTFFLSHPQPFVVPFSFTLFKQ